MDNVPKIISGGRFSDNRGIVNFVNDFVLDEVKRFYIIEHSDIKTIRAWQGHQFEKKWLYVLTGSFDVRWVQIKDMHNPSQNLKVKTRIISSDISEILCFPEGFATGFRALEPHSKLLMFSNKSVHDSLDDDYRWPEDFFHKCRW